MTKVERRSRFAYIPNIMIVKVVFLVSLGGLAATHGFTPITTTTTTTKHPQRRLTSSSSTSTSTRRISFWKSQRKFSVVPLYQSGDESAPAPLNATATTSGTATTLEVVGAEEELSASDTHRHENPDSLKNMLKFALPALGIYLSNPMLSNIDNGT